MPTIPNKLLAQLEVSRLEDGGEEARKRLSKELEQFPDGIAEAAVYEKIWSAFDALKAEKQIEQFQRWDADWQHADDAELIEWQLAGELHPDNEKYVLKRKTTDPDFARLYEEQVRLSEGFSALKDDNFRQQLRKWEHQSEAGAGRIKKLKAGGLRIVAVAASVLVLLMAGTYWFVSQDYTDQAIAAKYYKQPPLGNTLGAGDDLATTYEANFEAAHRAMIEQDYAAAKPAFEALESQIPPASFEEDDIQYYQDNLDWNLVLVQLGLGQSDGDLLLRLDRILADSSHTYYKEALLLKADLTSFWR